MGACATSAGAFLQERRIYLRTNDFFMLEERHGSALSAPSKLFFQGIFSAINSSDICVGDQIIFRAAASPPQKKEKRSSSWKVQLPQRPRSNPMLKGISTSLPKLKLESSTMPINSPLLENVFFVWRVGEGQLTKCGDRSKKSCFKSSKLDEP